MKHIKYQFTDGTNSVDGVARCRVTYCQLLDDLRLPDDCDIFFNGKKIDCASAIALVEQRLDEEQAKFEATHTKIWVHQGATTCKNTYRAKYIRK